MTPTLTRHDASRVREAWAGIDEIDDALAQLENGRHIVIAAQELESIKRQVRNEALEEAAKACDLDLLYSKRTDLDGPTLLDCATAIRSLKADGGGK